MLNDNELFMVSGASGDAGHVLKVAAVSGASTYTGVTSLGTLAVAGMMEGGINATSLVLAAVSVAVAPEVLVAGAVGVAVGALLAWAPWD